MQVFICWSGARSHTVAVALRSFLKQLNEKLSLPDGICFKPFFSEDIEKGLLWFQTLGKELATADVALLSMTPENATSPWMHFEAGAVANQLRLKEGETKGDAVKPRVFAYLFGLEPRDLKGPLAAYQSTVATFEDTRALVRQLLSFPADGQAAAGAALDPPHWNEDRFRDCWDALAEQFRKAHFQPFSEAVEGFEEKFRGLTFQEPVAYCHRQAWIDRINACVQVLVDLRNQLEIVKQRCRPYEVELYQQLLTSLDTYEMTMHAYLVKERKFELDTKGVVYQLS